MVVKVIALTEDPQSVEHIWVTARGDLGQVVLKVPEADAPPIGTVLTVTVVEGEVVIPEALTDPGNGTEIAQ